MCDLSWFIFCFEFEWTSPVSLCIIVSCEFLCVNYLVVTSRCFIRFYRNKYWDRFPPLATSFVGFFITHIHIHSNSFSSLSPGICWYLWVLILRQIFILRWWLTSRKWWKVQLQYKGGPYQVKAGVGNSRPRGPVLSKIRDDSNG